MSSESARKEFRELAQMIRKNGFKVVPGGGHYKILNKKGQRVTDDDGPLILSSSPSDFRARDLAVTRLVNAGVLKKEQLPWTPQKPKVAPDAPGLLLGKAEDRQVIEKKIHQERAKDSSRSAHERTQLIRSRLEPLLSTLGGWTKRGMLTELADVAYDYGKGTPHGYKAKSTALAGANNLKKGGTLSEGAATLWEAILDDLDEAPDMQRRWFDLVRESRGLPPKSVPVFAQRAGSVVSPEEDEEKILRTPRGGALLRQIEGGRGSGERYDDHEHPVLELHRDGGVRWNVDFTIDELNELNRAVGFFEGLAVQLSVFEGQELVEPALEKIRRIVEKVGEARFRELAGRASDRRE